jgi:hypothetical protein
MAAGNEIPYLARDQPILNDQILDMMHAPLQAKQKIALLRGKGLRASRTSSTTANTEV